MKHTNKIAIKILTDEYGDYPRNAWHYDSEYKMLIKTIEASKLCFLPVVSALLPSDDDIREVIELFKKEHLEQGEQAKTTDLMCVATAMGMYREILKQRQ